MIITKNKLFSGMLGFGLITILLVLFDIQYFYLRAIFSFIFLTTIPGLLIMLIFKIRSIWFWEYLVYTIGLSIAFLMFAGLAVNWTLPWLHITDKPLSLTPLLISFNILLIIFGFIAYMRNRNISLKIELPKFNWLNKVVFTFPIIFPILSILGAITLNNDGPNYLTMFMIGGIAVYVFMVVLFRNKLNENIYPWAILLTSISLLLMFSLRSWHISGWDTHLEYEMFQLTKGNFHWSMSNFPGNAYNACLSITILPTIFSWFLKINDEYVFKLLFPVLFSLVPLGMFLLSKKYASTAVTFLACIFFISPTWFFQEMPTLARQEIAFLFFILSLLILFNRDLNSLLKKTLFLFFGFSMIVSHYSTTYVALAFFVLTYLIFLVFRKTENVKLFSKIYERLSLKEKWSNLGGKKYYLSGTTIIILIVFAFLWYAQLTKISSDLVTFTGNTIKNMGNIFTEELSISTKNALLITEESNTPEQIEQYTQLTILNYRKNRPQINFYKKQDYVGYNAVPLRSEAIQPIITSPIIRLNLFHLFQIIKFLINGIFILIGLSYLLFKSFKQPKIDNEFIIMTLVGVILVGIIMFVPYTSTGYNLDRLYQQMLLILALPTVFGGLIVFKFLKEHIRIIPVSIIFILFFLFYSGFIFQFIGGSAILSLNNFGQNYDEHYTHTSQVLSSLWMSNNYNKKYSIYSDELSSLRLFSFARINNAHTDILPSIIDKNSYVYTSYTNIVKGMTFSYFKGQTLLFNFPTKFLNDNKNLIYNNGESEVFK